MKAVRPQGRELHWRQPGGTHRSRPRNNSHTPLDWINIGGGRTGRRRYKPAYPPPQEPSSNLRSSTDKFRVAPPRCTDEKLIK
eukprot:5471031-Pleurochrysis_carterae.AAC.1